MRAFLGLSIRIYLLFLNLPGPEFSFYWVARVRVVYSYGAKLHTTTRPYHTRDTLIFTYRFLIDVISEFFFLNAIDY